MNPQPIAQTSPVKRTSTSSPARSPALSDKRVIAITGASDFIGTELIRRLEGDLRYDRLLAIDIRKPAAPSLKMRFCRLDLTLPSAGADLLRILAEEQVDTLVHAAFLSSPTHNPTWAHELESIGTMHVLNACSAAAVKKIVAWSQTLVYGPHPKNPGFLTEDHELHGLPQSRFVSDKLDVERQLRYFAKEHPGVEVTVLRTATLLGPTVRNFATRFFSLPICPMLMGFDPLMQFVHEQDVIDAFALALTSAHTGVFNVTGDGVLPYSTILALMGRIPLPLPALLARPLSRALWATQAISSPPDLLDFLRYLCIADGARARAQLGFTPRHNIKDTIDDFVGISDAAQAARELT